MAHLIMRKKGLFAAFWFVLGAENAYAAQNLPLVLADRMNGIPLGENLQYFIDPAKTLTIDQITRLAPAEFKNSRNRFLNLGPRADAVWTRIVVRNPESEPRQWYLQLDYPLHDYVDFFVFDDGGGKMLRHSSTGDRTVFENRDLRYRKFVFDMKTPGHTTHVVFIRFEGEQPLDLGLTAWTAPELLAAVDGEEKFLGFYYGAVVMLLLYNLFIFISVRDISYFYYCLFLLIFVVNMFIYNGTGFQLFWPSSPWFQNNDCFFIFLNTLTTIQFGRVFLNLRTTAPRFNKILLASMGIAAIFAVISIGSNKVAILQASAIVTLLAYLILISVAVLALFRKFRAAKFYLFGWCMVFAGLLIAVLKMESVLPANFLTNHSMEIGSAFEVLFFAFGLADRINLLRDENAALERLRIEDKKGIARDIHDVLGNEFSMRLMEIQATGDSERELKLAAGLRSTLQKIREFLYLLHAEKSVSESLISNVTGLLQRLEGTGLFKIKSEIDFPAHRLSSSDAYHLERAIEEGVSNLARHSKAGSILLRLYEKRGRGVFILADDGVGFDKNISGKKGIGLESLRYRAERLQGRLRIWSRAGAGTTIVLAFQV